MTSWHEPVKITTQQRAIRILLLLVVAVLAIYIHGLARPKPRDH